MAEHGLLVHSDQNEENWRTDQILALNRYPIDVAGAGDSFLTAAALSLSINENIWRLRTLEMSLLLCRYRRQEMCP